ncbi:MAG: sigma-70 family RNA polymerase sigma factor [Polyangiaceae bacterium]
MQDRRTPVTPEELNAALSGDRQALASVIGALRPVVQVEVVAVLSRSRGAAKGRPLRQEVDDFVQEVFTALFASQAKELRRWRPEIAPLESFVRGIAYCDAISILRSRKSSPYTEDPTAPDALDPIPESEPSPESATISRDMLNRLVGSLRDKLGPRGTEVFELLILRERPIDEVCHVLAMSEDAVYAWRSRIGKLARKLHRDLLSE